MKKAGRLGTRMRVTRGFFIFPESEGFPEKSLWGHFMKEAAGTAEWRKL
ncbi:hypothetical protein CE91St56_10320 [Lachnospiraceae bacterium]|nr:hypothetical protein CE91St56_10320 [Lachnospiraceae bacterium]GKH39972.1 hypothetical protein CE91St57_09460 [Lachnospiraceae bacterium]